MGFPFAPAPDDEALVAWCAARVTPDILVEIAEGDYGYDRDKCLAWLQRCEAERRVTPHDGACWEHLRLVINGDHKRSMSDRDHLMRAFAGSILLSALATGVRTTWAVSIPLLARASESAFFLGVEARAAAVALMTAMIDRDTRADEINTSLAPFAATCLLVLNAHERSADELRRQLDGVDALIDATAANADWELGEILGLEPDPPGELVASTLRTRMDAGELPWLTCLDTFNPSNIDSYPWTRLSLLALDRRGEVCEALTLLRERLKGPTWRR